MDVKVPDLVENPFETPGPALVDNPFEHGNPNDNKVEVAKEIITQEIDGSNKVPLAEKRVGVFPNKEVVETPKEYPELVSARNEVVRLSKIVTDVADNRLETDIGLEDNYWTAKNNLLLAHKNLERLSGRG